MQAPEWAGGLFVVPLILFPLAAVTIGFLKAKPVSESKELGKRIAQLKDENASVRIAAAYDLGRIGHVATIAIPVLKEALHDENNQVREKAAEALKRISKKAAKEAGLG